MCLSAFIDTCDSINTTGMSHLEIIIKLQLELHVSAPIKPPSGCYNYNTEKYNSLQMALFRKNHAYGSVIYKSRAVLWHISNFA